MRTLSTGKLKKISSVMMVFALLASAASSDSFAASGGTFVVNQTQASTPGGLDNTQSITLGTTQTNKSSELASAKLANDSITVAATPKNSGTIGNNITIEISILPIRIGSVGTVMISKSDTTIRANIQHGETVIVTSEDVVNAFQMRTSGMLRGGLINVTISQDINSEIIVTGGNSNEITSETKSLTGGTTDQAQINTLTIGGVLEIGDTFTLNLPQGLISFVTSNTDVNMTTSSINAAIQAIPAYNIQNYTTSALGNIITVTAKTAGDGFSIGTVTAVNASGVPQIITFTPTNPQTGETFRATINGTTYDYAIGSGDTVASILNTLTSLMDTHADVICTKDSTSISCTTLAGSLASYSANVIVPLSTDTTAPVLTLQGDAIVTVGQNDLYLDAGATALDDTDGDITSSIVTSTGGFDARILGEYTITYTVTDRAGNDARAVTRTVKVVDQTAPVIVEVSPITTPSTDSTPDYSFSTTEVGTIVYGGSCASSSTTATINTNTITLSELPVGTYINCTIAVKDTADNTSNILTLPSFTITAITSSGGGGGGGGGSSRSSSRTSTSTTTTTEEDGELICRGPSENGTWYKKCSLDASISTFSDFAANAACEGFITPKSNVEGYEMTKTAPRKEVVAVAVSMLKKDGKAIDRTGSTEYKNHFADIGIAGQDTWIQSVVETALAHGIISDSRDTFQPENAVTRAEAYAMIMSAVCLKPTGSGASWQENVYMTAQANGLTARTWTTFESENAIMRQDLFVVASRAADWAEKTGGCNPKPTECIAE